MPSVDNTDYDLVVYTDGASKNNQDSITSKAGFGVWFGHNDPRYVLVLLSTTPAVTHDTVGTSPNAVPDNRQTIEQSSSYLIFDLSCGIRLISYSGFDTST
jgi:hypothetical protein